MKTKLLLTVSILCVSVLTSCYEDELIVLAPADRTVLVYVMGDNNLRQFAGRDVEEMVQGTVNADLATNNLIVYFDNGSSVELFRLSKDGNGAVSKDIIRTYDKSRNSAGINELIEVFQLVANDYPAGHFGLEIWSHGDGWVNRTSKTRWIGQDGDKFLNVSDLKAALEYMPHLDFLFFDACFMSSVEVAYELRHYADYFIGSPTEIPGPGSNYMYTVPAFFNKSSAHDVAIDVAESYFRHYADNYQAGKGITNENWTGGVSVSIMQSDQLEALAQVIRSILQQPNAIKGLDVAKVMDYDRRSGASHVGYYDLWQIIQQINGQYTTTDAVWKSAFARAVPYAKSTPMNYSAFVGMFEMRGFKGISVYLPVSATRSEYKVMDWYRDSGWGAFQ